MPEFDLLPVYGTSAITPTPILSDSLNANNAASAPDYETDPSHLAPGVVMPSGGSSNWDPRTYSTSSNYAIVRPAPGSIALNGSIITTESTSIDISASAIDYEVDPSHLAPGVVMPTGGRPDWNAKLYATASSLVTQEEPGEGFPSFSAPTVKPAWADSEIAQDTDEHDYIEMEDTPLNTGTLGSNDDEA